MKKLNKLVAILVAMAMVLSLTVVSAFAAGIKGTEDNPAKAYLVKELQVPTGTDPTSTFTWLITQDANDTKTATIGTAKTLSFAKTDTPASEEGGLTTYKQTMNDVFENVTYPGAGVYNFTIVEQYKGQTKSTTVPDTEEDVSKVTTTIQYSDAQYTAKVGVATKADGTPYVDSIAIYNEDGEKVTATNTDDNDFKYINKLSQKITNVDPQGEEDDPENTNDSTALDLTKAVEVATGSEQPLSNQEFSFNVALTKAALDTRANEEISYQAWRVSEDGETKTSVTLNIGDNAVKLYAGERLVLEEVDVGLGYQITEAEYPAYTTNDNMADVAYVSIDGNTKGFTNTYDSTKDPETGLSISNLPFIVLALVAIGGLVAYVVVRRKSEDNA